MKSRILYIIFWTLLGSWITSCESWLEEVPQNKLKPSTTDDYEQLLNKGYLSRQVMPYIDVLSDDVDLIADDHVTEGPDMGDEYLSAYLWENHHETSMSGGDGAFDAFYESILYANVVLESINEAIGVELDETNVERTRKNIRGEAYALRAYSYFYLVNLYAKPYHPETCATDPGVPYTESTGAEDKAYQRYTVKEVYDHIVSDLKEAIRLMDENPVDKVKYKFNSLSARALLARVYLYMQNWDQAIAYAEEVIKRNPELFHLWEAGEILNEENNAVSIWNASSIQGKDYLSKDNANVLFVNGSNEVLPALSYNASFSTFSVNRQLAAQFELHDVRRFYFMHTYMQNTYAGPRIKLTYAKNRYVSSATDPSLSHSRVIRTEEMYLILAEAYAHKTNGIASAVGYLNQLRETKFRTGRYTDLRAEQFNQSALLDYIALERRRELCFEGHRWFDLRRTTRPAMERTGYTGQKAVLKKDDPRYVLQIPQRELDINPAIGMNPR